MQKILAIFLTIIMVTLSGFAVLWAMNPRIESDLAQSTQGIRLEGSAVFYNASDTSKPNKLHIGDLLIGDGEQVFRINEIRKSQDGTIYVIVSWKNITDYTSYDAYQMRPYENYKTYKLVEFTYDKHVLSQDELASFYKKFSQQIAEIAQEKQTQQPVQLQRQEFAVTVKGSAPKVSEAAPLASTLVEATDAATDQVRVGFSEPTYNMSQSGALDAQSNAIQAISATEVAVPENLDPEAVERVESHNSF